ncbi:MAG: hypothetical protein NYU40_02110 [Aigarchaeota archaeon]|jgi:hypothetical protein|nr:hypothetical protein [Candidatus Caldarchaeales archaeon]
MKRAVVGLLVLASLAAVVAGMGAAYSLMQTPLHRGGFGWGDGARGGYGWWNQTQVTTSESVLEGTLSDADWRYLEVSSSSGVTRIAAPGLWQVDGQTVTFFKLFAEDKLNIGDNVRIVVVTVTASMPNGGTYTVSYAKQITDLTTGVDATAVQPLLRRGTAA